jgi:hypothetical protein
LPRKWNSTSPRTTTYTHLSSNLTPTSSPGSSPQPSPSLSKRYTTNGVPSKPGAIDNSSLIDVNLSKVSTGLEFQCQRCTAMQKGHFLSEICLVLEHKETGRTPRN